MQECVGHAENLLFSLERNMKPFKGFAVFRGCVGRDQGQDFTHVHLSQADSVARVPGCPSGVLNAPFQSQLMADL